MYILDTDAQADRLNKLKKYVKDKSHADTGIVSWAYVEIKFLTNLIFSLYRDIKFLTENVNKLEDKLRIKNESTSD